MAKKKYYKSMDKEYMDNGGMLNYDYSQTANLPQDVKYVDWAKYPAENNSYLDSSIKGIDNQIKGDSKKQKKGNYPGKF